MAPVGPNPLWSKNPSVHSQHSVALGTSAYGVVDISLRILAMIVDPGRCKHKILQTANTTRPFELNQKCLCLTWRLKSKRRCAFICKMVYFIHFFLTCCATDTQKILQCHFSEGGNQASTCLSVIQALMHFHKELIRLNVEPSLPWRLCLFCFLFFLFFFGFFASAYFVFFSQIITRTDVEKVSGLGSNCRRDISISLRQKKIF